MGKPKAEDTSIETLAAGTVPQIVEPITALTPAAVIGVSTQLSIAQELLPEEFRGVGLEVIETGFSPTVKWNQPGNFIAGQYLSFEEKVGPNSSRLYNFKAKNGKSFGVWGTTVLDRAFDAAILAGTIAPGRLLMITFMGSVPTDKEPCKLFHIAVAKTKS